VRTSFLGSKLQVQTPLPQKKEREKKEGRKEERKKERKKEKKERKKERKRKRENRKALMQKCAMRAVDLKAS
jgi:hypothetical protein